MTSRTRPVPPRTDGPAAPARSLALLALMAGAALSGACGILSRPIFARYDASEATTPEQQAALLGADPMLPQLWLWSASAPRQTTPEAALAVVERGRRYLPDDPDLLLGQVSLLNLLMRFDAMQQLALSGLQGDCPTPVEVELRWALVAAALAANDTAAAESEAVRLGGVQGVPPEVLADAWARIAATREFLGQAEQADQALERSLDLGPGGLRALREVSAREPARQAACKALVSRAQARHPDHPDLALERVVSALLAQNTADADQALAQLPAPLPERLERDVELMRAKVDVLAGRTGPALVVLRARLDDNPADVEALATLIECWRLRQVPSAEEMRVRLSWASGRISHPGVAAQVQILLRELPAPPEPVAAPEDAPAPP